MMREEARFLIEQMQQGSITAFDQFYETYASLVIHTALGWMGDRTEAEDVCHDVFIEVLNKADQYDPSRGSIEAWLAVRTKYRCLDRLRRKQRESELTGQWRDVDADVPADDTMKDMAEIIHEQMEQERLREAMRAIPPLQRKVLYGSFFEMKTHKELAEKLKCPLGTIKSSIRYGLNNLRKQLQQLEWKEYPQVGERHE